RSQKQAQQSILEEIQDPSCNCISLASTRTQEYLVFKDPEGKLQPSPLALTQVFLMTYITQSVNLDLTDTFNCTAMTPEQRILLGADWVWAILEKPTKNPKVQIAVQVLHLPEREEAEEQATAGKPVSESIQMARTESRNKNAYERMVEFCKAIGKDCYPAGLQQISGRRLSRPGDLRRLGVVLFGPLDFLQKVRQVSPHGNVVSARLQMSVEVFVVLRVLFQNQAVSQHQVREPIRRNCSVHVYLVFVLKEEAQSFTACNVVPNLLSKFQFKDGNPTQICIC
uniref:RAB15 effector protein n=1 Tax=Poecilia mexicana TaxID=48701 RepID=A0A3B3XHQ5_9TELE